MEPVGDLKKPPPTNKQYSGNPILDRIQDNIRELVARVKFILSVLDTVGVGSKDIELPDRDYAMTIDEAASAHWSFTGPLTAGRRVIVPSAPSRARSFIRWITNTTGQTLTFVVAGTNSTANVNTATTRAAIVKNNSIATLT